MLGLWMKGTRYGISTELYMCSGLFDLAKALKFHAYSHEADIRMRSLRLLRLDDRRTASSCQEA